VIATILTNTMVIIHLQYEAFSSQIPHIRKKTTLKSSWSHDQMKAALATVNPKMGIKTNFTEEEELTQELQCPVCRRPNYNSRERR
jgi:hypothetical protein